MVLDTSALVSFLMGESSSRWVKEKIEASKTELVMSTVNLTETYLILCDRKPSLKKNISRILKEFPCTYEAPTFEDSLAAGEARLTYPLNLGDCFAYALAKRLDVPILTLDKDFKKCNVEVILP